MKIPTAGIALIVVLCCSFPGAARPPDALQEVVGDAERLYADGDSASARALADWLLRQPELRAGLRTRTLLVRALACVAQGENLCGPAELSRSVGELHAAGGQGRLLAIGLAGLVSRQEALRQHNDALRRRLEQLIRIDLQRPAGARGPLAGPHPR